LNQFAECANEVNDYCKWFISNLSISREIMQSRESLGLGANQQEIFAVRDKAECLPWANETICGLLSTVISYIPMPDEHQARFLGDLRTLTQSTITPKEYAEFIENVGKNPTAFGLDPGFKLPEPILEMIAVAKKINDYE
jgi:hypothetical protein